MKLSIRVDSSFQIGSGHLMRCLTLAEYLREVGWEVGFVCRDLPGNLTGLLKERGLQLSLLPAPGVEVKEPIGAGASYADWLGVLWEQDVGDTKKALEASSGRPDWLLVDHYALDRRWEEALASHTGSILVIDDLANRPHACRALLDHNLSRAGRDRYFNLVPADCRLLCGPAYALLRPEFGRAASAMRERDGAVHRILIFFGGVDATGETLKACEAVVAMNGKQIEADVVVGVANVQRDSIEQMCNRHPKLHFHSQVRNMAELMAAADLAIGAGGTTTWERAYLGLPTIVIPVAENQLPATVAMAEAGAVWNLGFYTGVTSRHIVQALRAAAADPDDVRRKGLIARKLVDGGGVRRVAEVLVDGCARGIGA